MKSRRKGHQFERDIANLFKKNGWLEAGRHLEYQSDEANGIDLKNTHPFAVQCKKTKENFSLSKMHKTLQSVKCDSTLYPLLVVGKNNEKPLFVMYAEDAIELLRMLKDNDIL